MEESRLQRILNKIGLILLGIFYVISVIAVIRTGALGHASLTGEKRITFAHWQLEDGFREGYNDAIIEYQKLKAKQGMKVRVVQATVPVRGYAQWFLTQLIGGDAADVVELTGSSDLRNQYFTALSPYLGEVNPYNAGSPLEGMPWNDTFADDMVGALDVQYSEYFSVMTFMMTTRMYVNVDLYQKATGSKKMPETLRELLDACEKIQTYGEKTQTPLIPIGVRGFDKGTIGQLFNHYNNLINADYNDTISDRGYNSQYFPIFSHLAKEDGVVSLDRFLQPVEIVTKIGKYFAKGFPAIDLEQTKFLFNSGTVAFFIDGTWNAFSMVNNSKFKVDVIPIPGIGPNNPNYRSLGRMTEIGGGLGGMFGIPKCTKNFDLALDFLKYITSYKISQLTMVYHAKWMSSLKKMDYASAFRPEIAAMCHCSNKRKTSPEQLKKDVELLEKCRPFEGAGYSGISTLNTLGGKTIRDNTLTLETIIIEQPENPKKIFWNTMLSRRGNIHMELDESIVGEKRTHWTNDAMRSAFAIGALEDKAAFDLRSRINMEGIIGRISQLNSMIQLSEDIDKLKEIK